MLYWNKLSIVVAHSCGMHRRYIPDKSYFRLQIPDLILVSKTPTWAYQSGGYGNAYGGHSSLETDRWLLHLAIP